MRIKMPTNAEHRAISLQWLARCQPCLIDQWPKELADLSFPTEFVSVPEGTVEEFFAMHDGKAPGPIMRELAAEMESRMNWRRHFVRLNSRSPKDCSYPFEVPATLSGREAILFLSSSMRVLDDLYEFKWVPEQPAFICLREWQYGLRSTEEYRCFVKDGELIAVTAYDYTKEHTVPADGGASVREAIDIYFRSTLKPALHIDTVVFDLWMPPRQEPWLVEINPYGLSDPCFFGSYNDVENATTFIQFSAVAHHALSEEVKDAQ